MAKRLSAFERYRKEFGRIGGLARAKSLTPERRREIAKIASDAARKALARKAKTA